MVSRRTGSARRSLRSLSSNRLICMVASFGYTVCTLVTRRPEPAPGLLNAGSDKTPSNTEPVAHTMANDDRCVGSIAYLTGAVAQQPARDCQVKPDRPSTMARCIAVAWSSVKATQCSCNLFGLRARFRGWLSRLGNRAGGRIARAYQSFGKISPKAPISASAITTIVPPAARG